MQPKILIFDIETAPILAWVWSLFKTTIADCQIEEDWRVLCYASKWYNKAGFSCDAYWFHGKFGEKSERKVVESMWKLLDEADVVVAHNGDRFDVNKMNSKFYEYGMTPPSPFKVVDTLKVSKSRFAFPTNRLNYIARLKSFGMKLKTDFDLWLDVRSGNLKECNRMLTYNKHDVELLEDIYTSMLPWISNHPNYGLYRDDGTTCCPKCGSTNFKYDGTVKLVAGVYRAIRCHDCKGWSRLSQNLLDKEHRQNLARNIAK